MELPRRFMEEFFKLSFPFPDIEKVRTLLERVYEAGLAENPDQDAKRWRKLERDVGEMEGKIIERVRVIPKLDPSALPGSASSMDVTYTVKDVPKREVCLRWLDEGDSRTLKEMLDAAIRKEEQWNKKDL
jgi:hypothetical protein